MGKAGEEVGGGPGKSVQGGYFRTVVGRTLDMLGNMGLSMFIWEACSGVECGDSIFIGLLLGDTLVSVQLLRTNFPPIIS